MNMEDIRHRARNMGIKPGRMDKTTLIRTIQRKEGNFDCFGTAYESTCDQTACLWRSDCFAGVKTATKTPKNRAA